MTYIADELRQQVAIRANRRCEYYRILESIITPVHEIDHIYAEKHGGATDLPNLSYSCADCNRFKGTDLCSIDPVTGEIVTLFHPLHDTWPDHFKLNGGIIEALTPQGRVTERLLHFNDRRRIIERNRLIKAKRYP